MTDPMIQALGEGWLGKLAVGGIALIAGWLARRPVETAAIMSAVNTRVETLFKTMETQLDAAHGRCTEVERQLREERARCDEELAALRAEIALLMSGPVATYTTLTRQPRRPKPKGPA